MKKYIVTFIIISSLAKLQAQDTSIVHEKYAWGFYPCINYYNLKFNSINTKPWMLDRPRNNEVMVGAGVNYGSPGKFYISTDISTDILTIGDISGTYTMFDNIIVTSHSYRLAINGYYLILEQKLFGVYLNLGTSFEDIFVHSESYKQANVQDTAQVFENFNLRQNFIMNGGLSVYFYNNKLGFANGIIALKAGYDWAPFPPIAFTWYEYNDNKAIKTNPFVSFNGLYLGIAFNIWFTKNR